MKPKRKRLQRVEFHQNSSQQALLQSYLRPRPIRNQPKIFKRIPKMMKDLLKKLFPLFRRIRNLSMITTMERKAMALRMVLKGKRAKKLIITMPRNLMLLQLLPQRLLDQLN